MDIAEANISLGTIGLLCSALFTDVEKESPDPDYNQKKRLALKRHRPEKIHDKALLLILHSISKMMKMCMNRSYSKPVQRSSLPASLRSLALLLASSRKDSSES